MLIPAELKIVAYQILWSEKYKERDQLLGKCWGVFEILKNHDYS
jgi:hypothetical protein